MARSDTWAVVLAGGDGSRLSGMTRNGDGVTVPKQFCSLLGRETLLELALARAERVVPSERILVSVTDTHRRWWRRDLAQLPPPNIVRQPCNRGTLPGLLLPLLEILDRDPAARVVVMPSDHWVGDAVALETSLRQALAELEGHPEDVIVLGMTPQQHDPAFGWLVPAGEVADGSCPVREFVEKPDTFAADRLATGGALVNSFILTARARRLVDLCGEQVPRMLWAMRLCRWDRGGPPTFAVDEVYAALPASDFSSGVLERIPEHLRLLPVPPCGWCDLGTPERVAAMVRGCLRLRPRPRSAAPDRPVLLDAASPLSGPAMPRPARAGRIA